MFNADTAEERFALAETAYRNNDLAEALSHLKEGLVHDPLNTSALTSVACISNIYQNFNEGAKYAKRVTTLEPDHYLAHFQYCLALEGMARSDDAIIELRKLTRNRNLLAADPDLYNDASLMMQRLTGTHGLIVVNPALLALKSRLDILVKMNYALQRANKGNERCFNSALQSYKRHIHLRTGGIEPHEEDRKSSMADFVDQFDRLIDDMQINGYRADYHVPFSIPDGLPLNGAHRIAAALALGKSIIVREEDKPAATWDAQWFMSNGYTVEEIEPILEGFFHVKPDLVSMVVLWSPVEQMWGEIQKIIDETTPIIFGHTFEFSREPFNEMIHDIYSIDCGAASGDRIYRKAELLQAHPSRVRVLMCEIPRGIDQEQMESLKTSIRDLCADKSPVDHFTTLHMSAHSAEAKHLFGIFFNSLNISMLKKRHPLSPNMVELLNEFQGSIQTIGLDKENCCIVGSSVLNALGLREADDIDFTLRSTERDRRFDGGVTHLSKKVDVVARNYPRTFGLEPSLTDDEMIDDPRYHFRIRGFKFAAPMIVRDRKQHQRRLKDLSDVALLGSFLSK